MGQSYRDRAVMDGPARWKPGLGVHRGSQTTAVETRSGTPSAVLKCTRWVHFPGSAFPRCTPQVRNNDLRWGDLRKSQRPPLGGCHI